MHNFKLYYTIVAPHLYIGENKTLRIARIGENFF